jgi:hypothetical protein
LLCLRRLESVRRNEKRFDCFGAPLTTDIIVSALFVRRDSIYKTFPAVDSWDIDRDARKFAGPGPVIAHPPCAQWGKLRRFARINPAEKILALKALDFVRDFGGVLEHPMASSLWSHCAGDNIGWLFPLYQHTFGHLAQKSTLLYIVGCSPRDVPPFPLVLGHATHCLGRGSSRELSELPKSLRDKTPAAFAKWLLQLARSCA